MSLGMSLGAFAEGLSQGALTGFTIGKKKTDTKPSGPTDLSKFTNGQSGAALGAVPLSGNAENTSIVGSTKQMMPPQGGLVGLMNANEGGGDYDTLYGFSNRDGKPFAGTKVSSMTLGDVYKFTDPNGDYAKWVAANNNGTVATPVGKFQFVGSTARSVANEMGLPDDTPFNAETQDAMFTAHARKTLAGAQTSEAKRQAIRNQWVGLKNVSDSQLDAAINQFELSGNQLGALPPIY